MSYILRITVYLYLLLQKLIMCSYPDLPPGSADTTTCVPYIFGYKVSDLSATRNRANRASHIYSIVLPGASVVTQQGTDGYKSTTNVISRKLVVFFLENNKIIDIQKVTLPLSVNIVSSTTNGVANPKDSIAGYNYENPMICHGLANYLLGDACCDSQPQAMQIGIQVTVSGLTIGTTHNLYEYDFNQINGVSTNARLKVPTLMFNAQSNLATFKQHLLHLLHLTSRL